MKTYVAPPYFKRHGSSKLESQYTVLYLKNLIKKIVSEFIIRCCLYSNTCTKQGFSSIQNNPKNQDPSYKMDSDFWDYLKRKISSYSEHNLISTDSDLLSYSEGGNTPILYSNKYGDILIYSSGYMY